MIQRLETLLRWLMQHQFVRYVFVGGVATVADWGTFWIASDALQAHYQTALVTAWFLGVLVHYTLSRYFAFRSRAKQVTRQVAAHITISIISLGLSALSMYILIETLDFKPMAGRVTTTAAIFVFNYFMHKYFTLNERWIK